MPSDQQYSRCCGACLPGIRSLLCNRNPFKTYSFQEKTCSFFCRHPKYNCRFCCSLQERKLSVLSCTGIYQNCQGFYIKNLHRLIFYSTGTINDLSCKQKIPLCLQGENSKRATHRFCLQMCNNSLLIFNGCSSSADIWCKNASVLQHQVYCLADPGSNVFLSDML